MIDVQNSIKKANVIWGFGILLSEGAAIWWRWVKVLYDWAFICFVRILIYQHSESIVRLNLTEKMQQQFPLFFFAHVYMVICKQKQTSSRSVTDQPVTSQVLVSSNWKALKAT